jgi:hypothetical protein
MVPFSFTHIVPEREIRRRAECLEVQAGYLPWFDWTDFRDNAEAELVDDLREIGPQLNLRAHHIERVRPDDGNDTWIRCSFVSETEMVVFKVAASAVW